MELPQPEGNDREKKVQKKRTLDGLKSPYKILYMFFIQNNFVCPLEAKVVCPLTTSSLPISYFSAIAACAAANLAIGTRNGEQET